MRIPFASELIAQVAPSLGIVVELEPEYGFAGELILPSGKRHLFRNTNFNVNPAGSTEIAKDKSYTNYFLRKHGVRVPEGKTFFSDALNCNLAPEKRRGRDEACQYAATLGFPVFAKPNNLSQGALVDKLSNPHELRQHLLEIFQKTNVALVERPHPGRDYRVVVLGEDVISAYERIALSVEGDGESTIEQLLLHAREALGAAGRPNAEIDPQDPRIDRKLKELALARSNVLPTRKTVALLDNANLSTGGRSVDVTGEIHSSFAALAIRSARILGLQLAGVDILADDLSKSIEGQEWVVLEVNAAPGLDNYASLGSEQHARVVGLYREILKYLLQQDTNAPALR